MPSAYSSCLMRGMQYNLLHRHYHSYFNKYFKRLKAASSMLLRIDLVAGGAILLCEISVQDDSCQLPQIRYRRGIKRKSRDIRGSSFVEVSSGFEPLYEVLQTSA